MKSVCVVGLGYIGLPTAVLAAQSGYNVFGFDVDRKKVEKINNGDVPFIEPEISERLASVLNKNFFVSTDLHHADCFVIAVPTPFKKDSEIKRADLSYVFEAAKSVAKVLCAGNLVILESTIPVGTTYDVAKFLEQETGFKLGIDLFVAHCPERVLPGKIFEELVKNDRVVGGVCETSTHLAKNFYSKFVKGHIHLTTDKTAEMIKLVENSSRDVQIAFANQVDAMCKTAGINTFEVIECANKHPRVNILNPGCGVGGHCIAVDPWFLVESFPHDSELLKTARNINDSKPLAVVADVLHKTQELQFSGFTKPKVLVLGLTFKADIDDMRESPALKIACELQKNTNKLDLAVCEPNIESADLQKMGFENLKTFVDGVKWADIIVALVRHKDFYFLRDLNLKDKIVLDTCGLLYKSEAKEHSERVDPKIDVLRIHGKHSSAIKNI